MKTIYQRIKKWFKRQPLKRYEIVYNDLIFGKHDVVVFARTKKKALKNFYKLQNKEYILSIYSIEEIWQQ